MVLVSEKTGLLEEPIYERISPTEHQRGDQSITSSVPVSGAHERTILLDPSKESVTFRSTNESKDNGPIGHPSGGTDLRESYLLSCVEQDDIWGEDKCVDYKKVIKRLTCKR